MMKYLDVENFLDYLENKLFIIKDNMSKLEFENSTDTDKYYRLQIQIETLENIRDMFYKLCSPWKGGETMKKFKVVRRFPMDPPVIEKSFDTKEEADAYVEDAREKENRIGGVAGMKASFSVETGELNYESEEETE